MSVSDVHFIEESTIRRIVSKHSGEAALSPPQDKFHSEFTTGLVIHHFQPTYSCFYWCLAQTAICYSVILFLREQQRFTLAQRTFIRKYELSVLYHLFEMRGTSLTRARPCSSSGACPPKRKNKKEKKKDKREKKKERPQKKKSWQEP